VKTRFLSRASGELVEAIEYYDEQRPGLGNELVAELDATLVTVTEYPEAWPLVTKSVRRALLSRFPYGVLYRVDDGEIIIAAFMDLRRDPKEINTV
jgi:hypothetical protein